MAEESARNSRLLANAAWRLQRPGLAAAVGFWRQDWEDSKREVEVGGLLARIEELEAALKRALIEGKERNAELVSLQDADGGAGRDGREQLLHDLMRRRLVQRPALAHQELEQVAALAELRHDPRAVPVLVDRLDS